MRNAIKSFTTLLNNKYKHTYKHIYKNKFQYKYTNTRNWPPLQIIAAVAAILIPSTTFLGNQFNSDSSYEYSEWYTFLDGSIVQTEPRIGTNVNGNDDDGNGDDDNNDNGVNSEETFDIENDWIDELTTNTPLKFLNEFIFSTTNTATNTSNDDANTNTNTNNSSINNGEEEKQGNDEDRNGIQFNTILKHLFLNTNNIESDTNTKTNTKTKNPNSDEHNNDKDDDSLNTFYDDISNTFTSLLTGEVSENAFQQLINHARNRTQAGVDGIESRTLQEVVNIFMTDIEKVKQCLIRNFETFAFENVGLLTMIDPTSIFYYLEDEDERKNPSWKRRVHRFCHGVDLNEVNYLNDSLKLAGLSYADTIEEIKYGLENGMIGNECYELIYCQMESYPGKPSHYLAVKRGQSIWSNTLEILLVIRGTKTVQDMLTDALLDAENYKGGKAHAGIMTSGKYLVEKHSNMMESLLELSNRKQIKLSIVGHSLGAGAGTIVGMELYDDPKYDVSVVGFGCPALLSKELSESTASYVTTVIGDSDIVPRMSAATIGNVILNILEYDWTSKARRDVYQALDEIILHKTSFLFSDETVQSILNAIDEKIQNVVQDRIKEKTTKRMDPLLYPPGNCIHFYRDGVAVSGAFTPASFFNEIDISRTMVDDHYISGYRRIFLDVMRNFHHDDHFSFDKKDSD